MTRKKLTKGAIAGISIAVIFVLTLIIIVGYIFVPEAKGLKNTIPDDPFYAEWQSYIDGNAKLTDVVVVGSHDAGSVGMMPLAETQGHGILDQLKGGVRYFDLRVTKNSKGELVIFHSIIKGQSFKQVLEDIKEFLDEYDSECLILDFQHLGDGVHQEVIAETLNILGQRRALSKLDFPTLNDVSVNQIRARGFNYAVIWPDSTEASQNNNLYDRSTALHSPYDGKIHRSVKIENLIGHYSNYFDSYDGNGIFVLQAQRTATTYLGKPSVMEKEFKPHINRYILSLASSGNLDKVNVIMRDYVVSDMTNVKAILSLNLAKGLVAANYVDLFTAKTQF